MRFSYSSVEGINLAWEGMHYWKDWSSYIGADDELGLIDYHMTGQLVLQPSGEGASHAARVKMLWDEMGIPHEVWDTETIRKRCPYLDPGMFGPPTRPEDESFWKERRGRSAAISPRRRVCERSSALLPQPPARCRGERRRVLVRCPGVSVDRADGRVAGVTLADGRAPRAKVVVNVAGPHSYIINEMAGVYESMNIKTRALRHEVHRASASGVDFEADGVTAADDDLGIYFRPEVGNHILIGSGDPVCDEREYVDPDDYDQTINAEQWEVQMLRANRRLPALGMPTKGHRRPV